MPQSAIVWFRQDLRVRDQPALYCAVASGRPVIALYLLDDVTPGKWAWGAASRWWLHASLESLKCDLAALNIPLVLARGSALKRIPELVQDLNAAAIFWTRQYEHYAIARDRLLKEALTTKGLQVRSFNGQLLFEPFEISKPDGGSYAVFTPFWRACRAAGEPSAPIPAPPPCASPCATPLAYLDSDRLGAWNLQPETPDWAGGLRNAWHPGEHGALSLLQEFLDSGLPHYALGRDFPAENAASRLSPHLHFGEISPRMVWHSAQSRAKAEPRLAPHAEKFLSEMGWREFAHHLLYHNPEMPDNPLRKEFLDFPWREDKAGFQAWTKGRTGYPIVDAGMRQLWQTGIIHNRIRMIAASFLVKDLLIPWQRGQAWFWDTLVDADLANNAMGWQWIAGCGADAAPYFRVFNPVLQGERFDPDGAYIRRFLPELAKLPNAYIHKPFAASAQILKNAGIVLGQDYPLPIIEHGAARKRALRAFAHMRAERPPSFSAQTRQSKQS